MNANIKDVQGLGVLGLSCHEITDGYYILKGVIRGDKEAKVAVPVRDQNILKIQSRFTQTVAASIPVSARVSEKQINKQIVDVLNQQDKTDVWDCYCNFVYVGTLVFVAADRLLAIPQHVAQTHKHGAL